MKHVFTFLLLLLPSISFPADYSVQLSEVRYSDLVRLVYGDILNRSFVLDKDVVDSQDLLGVNWSKLSKAKVEALMIEVSKMRGFRSRDIGNVLVVDRQRPEDQNIVLYRPKHRPSRYLSDLVTSLTGATLRVRMVPHTFNEDVSRDASAIPQPQQLQQFDAPPVSDSSPLVDDDQLAFLVEPHEEAKVLKLLADVDTPQGEVMLRAAVYEVSSTQGEGGAINLAAGLLHGFGATLGAPLPGASSISFRSANFDVVLAALDSDARFKILSRPQVRVQSGSQAKFSVGQDVPTLGSSQLDKNGNPVQSIVYQQSGIILTTTPAIRDSVIDLTIAQEMSSFSATTTGVNQSPTLYKRSVNSKLSIQPGEVVVFAGLQETREEINQTKAPFFSWNLSREEKKINTEILVFVEAVRI